MSLEVDLGSPQSFNELQMLVPNSSNDYPRGYSVAISNDGSSWATVANCTGSGPTQVVSFPLETARYLKITLTASVVFYWWSVDEFYLYNTTVAPPSTTTTATVPPTTTTTSVPPFRHHYRCRYYWPRDLYRGTLIATHHGFFVVMGRCSVLPVLGARALVSFRDLHGRHFFRWDWHFRLGSPMHHRLVELQVGPRQWVVWNGGLFWVPNLSNVG